jgi:hypothetical protein
VACHLTLFLNRICGFGKCDRVVILKAPAGGPGDQVDHETLKLLLLLFLISIVIPVIAGLLAPILAGKNSIVILEALVGWPDLNLNPDTIPGLWVGLGAGVGAFAVLGIPAILGAVITVLLENVKRSITMSIWSFLKDRDDYTSTEVYGEFKDKLKEAGVSDAECQRMSERAVRRASRNWYQAMDESIRNELENAEISQPREFQETRN